MSESGELAARYEEVGQRVADAAAEGGRRGSDVIVVAVSKYADMDRVRALAELGHRDFGEGRAQQLVQRASLMAEYAERRRAAAAVGTSASGERDGSTDAVRWHMIGSLQRNKVKKVLPSVRLIQSMDSLRLLDEINAVAVRKDLDAEVLVQVNATGEDQKSGCPIGAVEHIVEQIDGLVHVHVRGLMCMGPTSQDEGETRRAFERTREIFEELRSAGAGEGRFNILSMGMSGDYELGLRCGANMVRVGSAIFGERTHDDPDDEGDSGD